MSEQKVYDKDREMKREARAVEEAEAFDEAADRASLEAVLDQDEATRPEQSLAPRVWAAPGADDGMRVPEQSDLQGGATDCTLTDPEGAS